MSLTVGNEADRVSAERRWMLRSGTIVVGPVSAALLLKGLSCGKIPRSAGVRRLGWARFRRLSQVREFSLRQVQGRSAWQPALASNAREQALSAYRSSLWRARDSGELLHLVLAHAMKAVRAHLGLAYRVRSPLNLPVISCVRGADPGILGQILCADDDAYVKARTGEIVVGRPSTGRVEATIARHLAAERLSGVILLPMFFDDRLCGAVELGRVDHPFRRSDRWHLEDLRVAAAQCL